MESLEKLLNKVTCGDCVDILKQLPDCCIDAIVTDPPAGISFMGRSWDSDKGGRDKWILWLTKIMEECFRILKPGGNALVWAIPRTSHWTATAIENAGLQIKEKIYHIFGSGFPKSLNISRAVDQLKGEEREVIGRTKSGGFKRLMIHNKEQGFRPDDYYIEGNIFKSDIPISKEAKEWQGYGSAMKPAAEEWIYAMKPLEGTFAENALEHGVSGINIDGTRILTNDKIDVHSRGAESAVSKGIYGSSKEQETHQTEGQKKGRWPPNVILSHHLDCKMAGYKKVEVPKHINLSNGDSKFCHGNTMPRPARRNYDLTDVDGTETVENWECHPECPIRIMNEQSGVLKSGDGCVRRKEGSFIEHKGLGKAGDVQTTYGDSGYASRFFYQCKPSVSERNLGMPNGIRNDHPTLKSLMLMRYLVRLLRPPKGGIILDPFGGSGTTAMAAILEDIDFIFIEKDRHYCDIAEKRIDFIRKNKERILMYGLENVAPKPSAQKEEAGKEGIFNL